MLPGKKYTPEDILLILRRRFWLLVVPVAVLAASTVIAARSMTDWYRSETLILVVPQRVPENYVRSTVTTRIEDRLHSISQQILSRTRLERVIQDFDLYKEERRTGIMEDIVEKMRLDIGVHVVKGDAFRVSFVGQDPRTVMKVTERLASLFIEENLKDRELLADGTNQFLESQLEDARRRLIEQEKKVETYRKKYFGELPTQLESNVQAISNTQTQIQTLVESINRDRDRRLLLERQIADESAVSAPEVAAAATASPAETERTPSAARQLELGRAQLKAMELRLKPEHPDIGIMKRRIQDLEQQAEAEALATPVTKGPSRAEIARQQRIDRIRQEIEHVDRQIAQKVDEEKRLRGVSAQYQARVDAAPTRETELVELTRDYDGLQKMYSSLQQKKEDSKLAANLERRQIGEQFKLLDPARIPERPFKPTRELYYLGGVVLGLAIGAGLVGFLEYRDRSFRVDQDVTRLLSLPVLAIVPVMQSDAERRRMFRRRLMTNFVLGGTVVMCFVVVAYAFLR